MKQNLDERRETKDERTPVKMLGEVCYYPNQRIAIDDLAVGEYVGVEHLVKNKGGLERSTQMPDAENAIEFCVGDVLIGNIRPYLRKIWLADFRGGASGDVVVIRVKKEFENKIDPAYLYKVLSSEVFFEYDNNNTKGAKMPRGDRKAIAKYPVPVPPLAEQQRIVAELDLLTGIIGKQKAQLKELDTLAQSIFYDMFGDPIENPKGWEVKKLGEICDSITDGDHMPPPKSESGVPFLTISDIDKEKRQLIFENTFFVPQSYFDSLKDNRKARVGDLLYTVTGSYGIPVVVSENRDFCFQRHIALIRPQKKFLSTIFLCFWALCKSVKLMVDGFATGIAQKTVGLGSIRKFPIILPPLALQQQFADKIQSIENQKAKIKASIVETQKLLDYTMDKYFG